MAGKTLRQLVDERDEIDTFLALNEGELTPETEFLLKSNEQEIEKKVERTARYIGFLGAEADAIDDEIKRLQRRKAVRETEADYLKNKVLAEALLRLGKDRIDTPIITVRKQLNNPRLDGPEFDQEKLEGLYKSGSVFVEQEITYKLDKRNLLGVGKASPVVLESFGMTIVRDESVRIA